MAALRGLNRPLCTTLWGRPASSSVTRRLAYFIRLMPVLFKFLSVFPLWVAHGVGWVLGWLAWALSSEYRLRVRENADQAGISAWARWRSVGAAGQQVAELPRLWFGKPVKVVLHGTALIDEAVAKRRGIVFLTPHLGCFEIMAQAHALRYGTALAATETTPARAARNITVLFRPPRKAWLTALVSSARLRPGLATAPTSLAGVKQLIKALKNGESVGLLPDQVPPAGQGVWSPFFGRNAYTMTLAVRLALQTDATLLFAWGKRLSWGRGYAVYVSPLVPLQTGSSTAAGTGLAPDLEGAVRQVNAAMEVLIHTCPQQYLWGYARYKQPKAET